MNSFFSYTYNRTLATFALGFLALALLAYAYSNYKMSQSYPMPTTISVNGEGEVSAVPDVGQFNFRVSADAATAAEAQSASAERNNAIIAYLKENGVEEKDIKTRDYNLSPKFRYTEPRCTVNFCPPAEPIPDGFTVSQMIEVKVRDVAKSGDLIANVGDKGATEISGLNFIVDDTAKVKDEARQKAIADAKANAEALAASLGVKLVRLTSYYEPEDYGPMPYGGMEMDMMTKSEAVANVPPGQNTTKVHVNLSYEVK